MDVFSDQQSAFSKTLKIEKQIIKLKAKG